MSDMFGIESWASALTIVQGAVCRVRWDAPSGLHPIYNMIPRALPWATLDRTVGAEIMSPNEGESRVGFVPRPGLGAERIGLCPLFR